MKLDYLRLWVFFICLIALGLLTKNWWLAIAVILAINTTLNFLRLRQIEQWLESGAKKRATPESSGLYDPIITHVLKIKARQKKHKARLSKVIQEYRDTVLALPDAAIVLNENLEILWSNKNARHLLGIHFSRDQGYRITNLIRSPELLKHLSDSQKKPLEINSPLNPEIVISIQVTQYGINQHLLLARDVSHRIRTRHALQHFVANASHELRTPLTVISGYVDIIRGKPELPADLHEPIKQIREKTDDMTQLVDDLLNLSKVESAGLESSQQEMIDLPKILNRLTRQLQKKHPDIVFTLDVNSKLRLYGVCADIKSLCTNLIDNACKHNRADTQIGIAWLRDQDQQALLIISDNGYGFDEKHIALITKRFYRINNQHNGSGLGLAIVKHIIINHGGELQIQSKPGKGSSFTAVFPASRTTIMG